MHNQCNQGSGCTIPLQDVGLLTIVSYWENGLFSVGIYSLGVDYSSVNDHTSKNIWKHKTGLEALKKMNTTCVGGKGTWIGKELDEGRKIKSFKVQNR